MSCPAGGRRRGSGACGTNVYGLTKRATAAPHHQAPLASTRESVPRTTAQRSQGLKTWQLSTDTGKYVLGIGLAFACDRELHDIVMLILFLCPRYPGGSFSR